MKTWDDAVDQYDELLDSDGDVPVAGVSFSPSRILRELDPIAYRCGLFDFIDSEGIDSDDLTGDMSRVP